MRNKRRTRRRVDSGGKVAADVVGTADWVLANEVGWGLPHGLVAILAATIVGERVVVGVVARLLQRRPPA